MSMAYSTNVPAVAVGAATVATQGAELVGNAATTMPLNVDDWVVRDPPTSSF